VKFSLGGGRSPRRAAAPRRDSTHAPAFLGRPAIPDFSFWTLRDFVGGQERVVWNPALSLPAKDFDFPDAETARIRVAVETWSAYGVAADRR